MRNPDTRTYIHSIHKCVQLANITSLSLEKYLQHIIHEITTALEPFEPFSIRIHMADKIVQSKNFKDYPTILEFNIDWIENTDDRLCLYTKSEAILHDKAEIKEYLAALAEIMVLFAKQQHAKEQINSRHLQIQQANQALQDFIYITSHDLQEPVRTISSFIQLLEKRYENALDEKAKTLIHFAVDGTERLQKMISNLLDYSRILTRGETFAKTDLNTILAEALQHLETQISQTNAKIHTAALPTLTVDAAQIKRVFINLLDNAIQFNCQDFPDIHIQSKEKENCWKIIISDNGIGIDPKMKDKVFNIFQRLHTRNEYPGDGMGLAVCKRILQRHDGDIDFTSTDSHGSSFYFWLPK